MPKAVREGLKPAGDFSPPPEKKWLLTPSIISPLMISPKSTSVAAMVDPHSSSLKQSQRDAACRKTVIDMAKTCSSCGCWCLL